MTGISFAEIPKPNLIKVVQTNRLGDAVYENGIGNRCWYDVGKVDSEEV